MKNAAGISDNQMIFSVQELKEKGFSYYKINQMVAQGILTNFMKIHLFKEKNRIFIMYTHLFRTA